MTKLLDAIDWLFRHTLRSVIFGIVLLAVIAAYMAVGSGLPAVREYFETDELGFFNAWPLKLLMVVMVANLVTVTLQRIPFTPPRYGVWMVHVGIVTLIAGTGWYYSHKIEGSALLLKGRSTGTYYDRWERALYFQAGGPVTRVPLPGLPRFHAYSDELKNVDYLQGRGMTGVSPIVPRGSGQASTAADLVGAKSLAFSVTAYWPYAYVRERLENDPSANRTAFTFNLPDVGEDEPRDRVLSAAMPKYARVQWGQADIEHRELPDVAAVDALITKAKSLHTVTFKVGTFTNTANVQVGDVIQLGDSNYGVRIESFDPAWQTIDKQIVPKLTIVIASPTQTFRRMILGGGNKATDFKLGDADAGPMGKRQKELLDPALDVSYAFNADTDLLPKGGLGKTMFLTTPNSSRTTVLTVEANGPPVVQTFDGERGDIEMIAPHTEEAMLMRTMGRESPHDHGKVAVQRTDHAGAVVPFVDEVPKAKRNRDEGTSGRRQVVRVRYTGLDSTDKPFEGETLVPFSEHPLETPWQGGLINVPNSTAVAQVTLGNNFRMLPAVARLDKLEAFAYAGMDASVAPMIRDYRSTITLVEREGGTSRTDTVFLNSPVFYAGGNWIFFQSQFDLQNQRWSVLGVGNRPGVYVMVSGCILIIVGIFYAFYVKPVLIRRMKAKAIAAAAGRKAAPVPSPGMAGRGLGRGLPTKDATGARTR